MQGKKQAPFEGPNSLKETEKNARSEERRNEKRNGGHLKATMLGIHWNSTEDFKI